MVVVVTVSTSHRSRIQETGKRFAIPALEEQSDRVSQTMFERNRVACELPFPLVNSSSIKTENVAN